MSLSKPEDLLHAQTAVACNICESDVPCEHFCFECNQTLCTNCKVIHGKVASSKDHNVVPRTQMGKKHRKSENCPDHGMPFTFHCESCKFPVCVKCVTDKHKGHEMSDLDAIIQQKSEVLRKYTSKMQSDTLTTLSTRGEEIREGKEKYEKKIDQIQLHMEEEIQAQHKELDVIYNERLKMLLKRKEADLLVYDRYAMEMNSRIEKSEGKITDFQRAIVKNSLPNVFEFSMSMKPLPEVGHLPDFPKPPPFIPAAIKNLKENVGNLKVAPLPKEETTVKSKQAKVIARFKAPLKGRPSICISTNGSVYLGSDESKWVVRVDKTGQILWKRNVLYSPLSLAVLENGDIILAAINTESKTVQRLPANGREEVLFDLRPSFSNGLSVTPNQRLLICTRNGKVMRTNNDHDKVRHLYDGMGAATAVHAIEDSNGIIYITDSAAQEILILKKDDTISTLKHTDKGEKFAELIGLAADAEGNILCSDKLNNCVYIIDQTKQVKTLVDGSHGLQRPRFIAVDNENNLWVTQYDGVILVVKYD